MMASCWLCPLTTLASRDWLARLVAARIGTERAAYGVRGMFFAVVTATGSLCSLTDAMQATAAASSK
jgi:hypothetical protein